MLAVFMLMLILLLLILILKIFFFFEGLVVFGVGWICTGRPSQSLQLSRKRNVKVIRCQRFQSRSKFLSNSSALVYLCELLFLSVFINIFSDLKATSVFSMYLTKHTGFFLTSFQAQSSVRYLNLPMMTSFKDVLKSLFPALIVPLTLQKGTVVFLSFFFFLIIFISLTKLNELNIIYRYPICRIGEFLNKRWRLKALYL